MDTRSSLVAAVAATAAATAVVAKDPDLVTDLSAAVETPVPADLSASPLPTTNATSTTPTKAESATSGNAADLQCVILEDWPHKIHSHPYNMDALLN